MILKPRAFIFDLNGTMIDDMAYHQEAWAEIVNFPRLPGSPD